MSSLIDSKVYDLGPRAAQLGSDFFWDKVKNANPRRHHSMKVLVDAQGVGDACVKSGILWRK